MATIEFKFSGPPVSEELTNIWERIEQMLQERGIVVLPSTAELVLIEAPTGKEES
jgi:hypothetical protein